MFYKYIENDIIVYLGRGDKIPVNSVMLSPEKYAELSAKTKAAPADTLEYRYRLSNETEEYIAMPRTHDETVDWYVQKVESEEMTLEEVPEDYRSEVEAFFSEQATEEDYISALKEMGVNTDEEV